MKPNNRLELNQQENKTSENTNFEYVHSLGEDQKYGVR